MTKTMTIDFVSDVVCPWCIIGLNGLEHALDRVGDLVKADIHFQPFELNPDMPPEGQNIREHVAQKYGSTPEQSAASRNMIRDRAAGVGFTMAMKDDSRIYNTFDAHRLLHWAGLSKGEGADKQAALETRPIRCLFHQGAQSRRPRRAGGRSRGGGAGSPSGAGGAGQRRLRQGGARGGKLLASAGISGVPAVIINGKYIISGGQPPEAFERAIRKHRRGNRSAGLGVGVLKPAKQFGVDILRLFDLHPGG